MRIVTSFDRKFFCQEWRVNFNFLQMLSIRSGPTFSSPYHPLTRLCPPSAQIFQTRVPLVKKKREKKRKRWSNPTIPSLRTIWISPFEAGFSSTWNNEGRRKRERERERIHKKNRYHSRRETNRESVARRLSRWRHLGSIKGCFATLFDRQSRQVRCTPLCASPSSVSSSPPPRLRADNHRAVIARQFSSIERLPRFSPRSKFSIRTRSFVIGFVTAWNRVNQIRDSINFDRTTSFSLINLYTFVYLAFIRIC